jgi:hypothetical protein
VRYVDSQAGWRALFFSAALACACGLGFRLHFSPERVKREVEAAIGTQRFSLKFDAAELRLARGIVPEIAVVMSQVEFAPDARCAEPSVTISSVVVPFRLLSLISGRPSVGIVHGDDLAVDLDLVKRKCDSDNAAVSTPSTPPSTLTSAVKVGASRVRGLASSAPPRWWTPEQLKAVQAVVEGFEFARAKLLFENKTKNIYLEDFSAVTEAGADSVSVSTGLRISPEVAYGETLPPFWIDAEATAESADVTIEARLSEGRLSLLAGFKPLSDGGVEIDAHAAVSSVPLSTLIPLLTKSGIASERFNPKFLWFNCAVDIKGPFQGLFDSSPMRLSSCMVEGGGSRLAVAKATRLPNGSWEPFDVDLQTLDIRRVLETFGLQGPDGVASNFGRLSGLLEVRGSDEAHFNGALEGVDLRFSNRNSHAIQHVRKLAAKIDVTGGRAKGVIDGVELERGRFEGEIRIDMDRRFHQGEVKVDVRELVFSDGVQRTMVNGHLGRISGKGSLGFEKGEVAKFQASVKLDDLEGDEIRAKEVAFTSDYSGEDVSLNMKAPSLDLSRKSEVFSAIKDVFFGREWGEWIALHDVVINSALPVGGGYRWDKAEGALESGKIHFLSVGSMNREHDIQGSITVDYPLAKKLKWSFVGRLPVLTLNEDSKALTDLRRRGRINATALGLTSLESAAPSSLKDSIYRASHRVIEKAKRISGRKSGGVEPAASREKNQ